MGERRRREESRRRGRFGTLGSAVIAEPGRGISGTSRCWGDHQFGVGGHSNRRICRRLRAFAGRRGPTESSPDFGYGPAPLVRLHLDFILHLAYRGLAHWRRGLVYSGEASAVNEGGTPPWVASVEQKPFGPLDRPPAVEIISSPLPFAQPTRTVDRGLHG